MSATLGQSTRRVCGSSRESEKAAWSSETSSMAVSESKPWSSKGSASSRSSGLSTNPAHTPRTFARTDDGDFFFPSGSGATTAFPPFSGGSQGCHGRSTRFGKIGQGFKRTLGELALDILFSTTAWAMVPEAPRDETPPAVRETAWTSLTMASGSVVARVRTSPRSALTAGLIFFRAPFGAASSWRRASIVARRPMAPATASPWPKADLAPDKGIARSDWS
mmetsp:Transcript_24894/g.80540  ORF Transcript_24894/g.80540 Transcript_24894/m.80540 type:complete len:221 (-) Transcript_24894:251-913(-)